MNEGGEYQERGLRVGETLEGTSGVECGGPEVCVGGGKCSWNGR